MNNENKNLNKNVKSKEKKRRKNALLMATDINDIKINVKELSESE